MLVTCGFRAVQDNWVFTVISTSPTETSESTKEMNARIALNGRRTHPSLINLITPPHMPGPPPCPILSSPDTSSRRGPQTQGRAPVLQTLNGHVGDGPVELRHLDAQ